MEARPLSRQTGQVIRCVQGQVLRLVEWAGGLRDPGAMSQDASL